MILVVVSLLQGIATGGEYAAATVLMSESGTRGHRGFSALFQAATIVVGLVLAQACRQVLQRPLNGALSGQIASDVPLARRSRDS